MSLECNGHRSFVFVFLGWKNSSVKVGKFVIFDLCLAGGGGGGSNTTHLKSDS